MLIRHDRRPGITTVAANHLTRRRHGRVRSLGLALTLLTAAPALAGPDLDGRYVGRGEGALDLQVFDLDDGAGGHFVAADTGIPNTCSGTLRGIARATDPGTLVLRRKAADAEETCTLTLRFSPDRTRVRMEARDCGDFHGTACDFVGALRRR